MKIVSARRFALWWQLAMDWFQRQFAAIAASIDFTPVEEKLDEVKSDVADVKTAVENIDFSALAKQGTNADATLTAVLEALTGGDDPSPDIPEGVAERLAMILEHFGIKTISGYEFMTDTEVTDTLEDIMANLDTDLGETVEYPEGSGTYMTLAQAITAEAMEIINTQNS